MFVSWTFLKASYWCCFCGQLKVTQIYSVHICVDVVTCFQLQTKTFWVKHIAKILKTIYLHVLLHVRQPATVLYIMHVGYLLPIHCMHGHAVDRDLL